MADDPTTAGHEPDGADEQAPAEAKPAKKPAARKKPAAKADSEAKPESVAEPKADAKAGESKPAPAEAKAGGSEPAKAEAEPAKPKPAKPAEPKAGKPEAEPESAKAEPGKPEPEPEPAKPEPGKAPARRRGGEQGVRRAAVRAHARYVRTSARKARIVCPHIRGKSVAEARAILAFTPRDVARDWSKLLESAVANAENNHELLEDELVVREAYADEGPTIKRFRPRAMGRATPIRKRTSHLTITLTPAP